METAAILGIDQDTARDLMSDFELHHNNIEIAIAELLVLPSEELLHQVFREVHTIKGNASMYALGDVVRFTHALENVMASLRSGHLHISHGLAEVIMMSMDRSRDLHQMHLFGTQFENLNIDNIEQALHDLTKVHTDVQVQQAIQNATNQLTNNFVPDEPQEVAPKSSDYFSDNMKIRQDLIWFRKLADQLDKQSIFWEQRSQSIFRWAQKMNAQDNYSIDPSQLAVAVYLHDIGMSFLSNDIINKTGKLSPPELAQLHEHPNWGMELVARMPDWHEAALMISQHHERWDGLGYPNKLSANDIHHGARIIAILDAFFAIIHERADRARRRSILRGVSEINACANSQFCPKWVDIFNIVIRDEAREGLLGN